MTEQQIQVLEQAKHDAFALVEEIHSHFVSDGGFNCAQRIDDLKDAVEIIREIQVIESDASTAASRMR